MDHWEILQRLGAALAGSALLGLEREGRGRAAGLRTTILVCMAATVAMILSDLYYTESMARGGDGGGGMGWRPDPARLGAGILTGMGFIGAGVIVRHGLTVQGVTTAALLWLATVLGFSFGGGRYFLGAIGVVIGAVTLHWFPRMERVIASDWHAILRLSLAPNAPDTQAIIKAVEGFALTVKSLELTHEVHADVRRLALNVKTRSPDRLTLPDAVVTHLTKLPGVIEITWGDA